MTDNRNLLVWIFQTGEPLHIDNDGFRPMRAMNLSDSLVEAGHNVVLWSTAFYHQRKIHRAKTKKYIPLSKNLEIRLIPSRGYQHNIGADRLFDHFQLSFNLKNILANTDIIPDVAFIGYPPIETAFVFNRWLFRHGVPTLIDVKDLWPSFFLNAFPKSLHSVGRLALSPYFYLARDAMRKATGISAMARGFLDWSLNFIGREEKNTDGIFPLTSPLQRVSKRKLEEARLWWDEKGILDDGTPRLCFIGSLSSSFDFGPIYDAAKKSAKNYNNFQFVICGDGSFSSEFRSAMGHLPNIFFAGWVDYPKIQALTERSIAAIAPYYNIECYTKSIPNKIIDYLSFGLPLLSPLRGEVERLIRDYEVGICYGSNTGTGRTLYDCICKLTENRDFRKRISHNCIELYKAFFSYDKVYSNLIKHIENLSLIKIKQKYIFYKLPGNIRTTHPIKLSSNYSIQIWKPTALSVSPKRLFSLNFVLLSFFYWFNIFKNRNYKILLIYYKNNHLVHYSVILPPHFRFPFMSDSDLQIGPIWTNVHHRRNGLALYALCSILKKYDHTCKTFWFVAREENISSQKLVEKMKFTRFCEGIKVDSYFSKIFSYFLIKNVFHDG